MEKNAIQYVFIEVTNHCNFSCTFCPDAEMKRKREFMEPQTVFKIIREIAAKQLTPQPLQFHLMGEPLLARDIFAYIATARGLGLRVRLLTNGALLNEATAKKIYASGLEELVIGIQAWGEESFRLNRRGRIDYSRYLENIRQAIALKFAAGAATRIYIHYLNTKHFIANRAHIGYAPVFSPGLIDEDGKALAVIEEWKIFGRSVSEKFGLGFSAKNLECLRGDYAHHPLDCLFGDHCEILPQVILGFKGISPFSDWLMKDVRYVEKHKGTCASIHEQLAILANGTATLCCVDYEGVMGVGNVKKKTVTALWNSRAARRARRQMDQGFYPHRLCRICRAFVVKDDYAEKIGDTTQPFALVDGFYNLEDDGQRKFRWIGKTARIRIENNSTALRLVVKNPFAAAAGEKMRFTLSQRSHAKTFRIPGCGWNDVVFPLKATQAFGDQVEIVADRFAIPQELDPGHADARELALMVGPIGIDT